MGKRGWKPQNTVTFEDYHGKTKLTFAKVK